MKLQQWIQTLPEVQSKSGRVYVDTGPILERELARKAGYYSFLFFLFQKLCSNIVFFRVRMVW